MQRQSKSHEKLDREKLSEFIYQARMSIEKEKEKAFRALKVLNKMK